LQKCSKTTVVSAEAYVTTPHCVTECSGQVCTVYTHTEWSSSADGGPSLESVIVGSR